MSGAEQAERMRVTGASPMEIRFDDGLWCYRLGPRGGGREGALSEREARWVLGRWLAQEPWREQLRRFAAKEIGAEARTDDGLIERVLGRLQGRRLGLWRVERMGLWDPGELAEAVEAEPLVTSTKEDETHWIHVVVVDEEDRPLAGVRYRIELTDGRVRDGRTDANGGIYFDGMPTGDCKISLVECDEQAWGQ